MTVHELYGEEVIARWRQLADELAHKALVWMVVAIAAVGVTVSLVLLFATRGLMA